MLSDNNTGFKNKMFEQISKKLGLEYKLYTLPYHPASNGRIESFHAFLKACIAKHVALHWIRCFNTLGLCCIQFQTI